VSAINFKFDNEPTSYIEDDFIDYEYNSDSNLRCTVCNCVSSASISDDGWNVTGNRMVRDKRDETRVICSGCLDDINSSLGEF
jgi:hypothetical protein